ncbi:MAG: ABC transporter, permease protein 1 (cluster 4, leucine/isoleucine/valine/benzoate) [uncultured Caballeronia sp.]|nr:MAG: ABC transporter, permease protein 1 (cluster 4, leucine/isoleucine/valine/benzoate) [uncultured Caballeronia sp.]
MVPITTIYYDSGFLIGLKGFVGVVIRSRGFAPGLAAGIVFVFLGERVQRGDRHADHSGATVAESSKPAFGRRRGVTR